MDGFRGVVLPGYILAATPRSGSTLLCALLRSSGVAGRPESLFRAEDRAEYAAEWGVSGWPDYLRAAETAAYGGTGLAGVRLMWPSCAELEGLGVDVPRLYGPTRFLFLQRGDTVGQAVSWAKAEMSGTWHLGFEEAAVPGVPRYDFARLQALCTRIAEENAAWEAFFARHAITPLRMSYEALSADPVGIAEGALRFLGVGTWQPLQAGNRKMADAESADWAARFRAES